MMFWSLIILLCCIVLLVDPMLAQSIVMILSLSADLLSEVHVYLELH